MFLTGVMGGPMSNPSAMVGMGNQMVPPYSAAMQTQMGPMGMGPQVSVSFFSLLCSYHVNLIILSRFHQMLCMSHCC